jgi:riboflavin kinase / FMN adenylyltransferase
MRVFDGSAALAGQTRGCVVTIGNFDGLHLGHQALLREVVDYSHARGRAAAVYTFDPHPRRILQPSDPVPRITSRDQLEHGLRSIGIDVLIREPFTRELSTLAPADFVEQILAQRLAPSVLMVGRDFHFGRQRSGSDDLLQQLGPRFGFEVRIMGQVSVDGADVSSTRVRQLVQAGQVDQVIPLLGHAYSIWGRVVRGDQRGRTIGFPTANLEPENDLIPAPGVYATTVSQFKGPDPVEPRILSITNVGRRPTFGGGEVRVETHLIEFDGDLYGARLAVDFWQRVRAEQRFGSVDALREQIARDCQTARALLD